MTKTRLLQRVWRIRDAKGEQFPQREKNTFYYV